MSDLPQSVTKISLDDLYGMTSHMYGHRNEERPTSSTFAHFVEVCAALTGPARSKRRDDSLDVPGALCKALAWFFPLMAKLKVRSVSEVIWRKYPYACPYCRNETHVEFRCKQVRGLESTLDHQALRRLANSNSSRKPVTLDEWQEMFGTIYPRSMDDSRSGRSVLGLLEELGELAEAVRVFHRHPKYLVGEAADVFSYLMGIANEHALSEATAGRDFSLEAEYLRRYPGLCRQCGYHVCTCPPIPAATVGRLAKELDVDADDLFGIDHEQMSARALMVADRVIAKLGGYQQLLAEGDVFPFDRGDAHSSLVSFCLLLADRIENDDPSASLSLRSAAFRVGRSESAAGSAGRSEVVGEVLEQIRALPAVLEAGGHGPPLSFSSDETGGRMTQRWRVLIVLAGPADQARLELGLEAREIEEAVRRGTHRSGITLKTVDATRVEDLRRHLLDADYDLLHLSGHGQQEGPILVDNDGSSKTLPLPILREIVQLSQTLRCVVLNCCYAATTLTEPVGPATVGMFGRVGDRDAIAFSVGFYDALAAGHDLNRAFQEACVATRAATGNDPPVRALGLNANPNVPQRHWPVATP